jgi:hypothetical protein
VTRRINLRQGNDIIEGGQAAVLLVVDFPSISYGGYAAKGEKGASTRPFKSTGIASTERLPQQDVLYDSRGAVELLKFCYTQADRTLSVSALRKFKKNFSSKSDCLAIATSGQPAWIEVDHGQHTERFFLSYAGKIALWGGKGSKVHNHVSDTYTNQNKVREAGLAPLMLIGNVDVPDSRMCEKLTKLPLDLFSPFKLQPRKSEALRHNLNASDRHTGSFSIRSTSRSSDASAVPSAADKPRRRRKREASESGGDESASEKGGKRAKFKDEPNDD